MMLNFVYRLLIITLETLYNETKKKFGESGTAALTGIFVLRFLMPSLALPESIGEYYLY